MLQIGVLLSGRVLLDRHRNGLSRAPRMLNAAVPHFNTDLSDQTRRNYGPDHIAVHGCHGITSPSNGTFIAWLRNSLTRGNGLVRVRS